MMGRLDSPRVGYFTNPLLNYSDGQQRVDKKPFITRWRLEPKPEDRERYLRGELVEPAKPIVFYIENSTPRRWRKYIKQGIEDWQAAFERAGFKNAIIAKELTDSMNVDKDDVNYSVLTYAASTKANAMGPLSSTPVRARYWKRTSCGGIMCWACSRNGLQCKPVSYVPKQEE